MTEQIHAVRFCLRICIAASNSPNKSWRVRHAKKRPNIDSANASVPKTRPETETCLSDRSLIRYADQVLGAWKSMLPLRRDFGMPDWRWRKGENFAPVDPLGRKHEITPSRNERVELPAAYPKIKTGRGTGFSTTGFTSTHSRTKMANPGLGDFMF